MSDLERAQEWLGCERQEASFGTFCRKHQYRGWFICEKEAVQLAALLAETRADELEDVAGSFASSAKRVVKAKGETERTRYADEVVEVLRNRAREIRDGD